MRACPLSRAKAKMHSSMPRYIFLPCIDYNNTNNIDLISISNCTTTMQLGGAIISDSSKFIFGMLDGCSLCFS